MTPIKQAPPKPSSRNIRDGAQVWITGALDIIVDEGIGSLRIERLAREIKVSKGSFYWFFDNLDDLLNCSLCYWKESLNDAVFDKIQKMTGSVEALLDCLIDTIFESGLGRYDAAIRAWALVDAKAQLAVREVDHDRLNFLHQLFSRNRLPEAIARQQAHLFYRALIAESYLTEHPDGMLNTAYLKNLVQIILSDMGTNSDSEEKLMNLQFTNKKNEI